MSGSGSVTIGGGSSGAAVTLDNTYVSAHLSMFASMTAEYASAGQSLYASIPSGTLLLVPDDLGTIAVTGTTDPVAVVAGDGDTLDYVGLGQATVAAGNGNDVAVAGPGDNVLSLGTGDNDYFLAAGNATIVSAGTDLIEVGAGNASISLSGVGSTIYGGLGTLAVDDAAGAGTSLNTMGDARGDVTTVAGASTAVTATAGTVTATQAGSGSLTFIGHGGSLSLTQADGAPRDALYAAQGSSVSLSGATHDNVFAANDTNKGNAGAVVLDGSHASGGNEFWAGSGNATLIGGIGTDTLVGGQGASTMTGGGGGDNFDLFTVQGGSATSVTITDFGGSDVLNLFGYGSAGLQYAVGHAQQAGTSTVISLNDGSTITLRDFDKSALGGVVRSTG